MNAVDYGKYKGVSSYMVTKWLKGGFLEGAYTKSVSGRYTIDPEKADALIAQRQTPTADDAGDGMTYSQARTLKEQLAAQLKQIELEEKRGLLVKKADVDQDAFNCARQIRDAMLSIPGRLSAQLAATTDEAAIRDLLNTEIRQALQGVSES